MSRKTVVVFVLLTVLLFQVLTARPARAIDTTVLVAAIAGSVVLLVGIIYVGARATYPEPIHMLAPGTSTSAATVPSATRVRFGPQCKPTNPSESPDSVPLLCW